MLSLGFHDVLPAVLSKYTSLKELHWHKATVTCERLDTIVRVAPHLASIDVLSIPLSDLSPEVLAKIGELFPNVTRLDIRSCIDLSNVLGGFDYSNDNDLQEEDCPYAEALISLGSSMTKLKHINLEHLDIESLSSTFRYALPREWKHKSCLPPELSNVKIRWLPTDK
jgi:hypothetical protein